MNMFTNIQIAFNLVVPYAVQCKQLLTSYIMYALLHSVSSSTLKLILRYHNLILFYSYVLWEIYVIGR